MTRPYSILIRIRPSCVSVMPWKPTRPLLPLIGLPCPALPLLPPELPVSLGVPDAFSPPLLPGREPQGMLSRCSGLCMTGELCTLMPGLTARRLKLIESISSSLRLLLLMRRVISSAVGGTRGPPCEPPAEGGACGVSDRLLSLPVPIIARAGPGPNKLAAADPADREGESILISSLMPDDEPRGRNAGGGGVTLLPATLPVSENVSQKTLPLEFFKACCLKLLDSPDSPIIISSSGTSSRFSPCRLGDICAAAISSGGGGPEGIRGSRSISLSRTWRITSASRRVSQSTGWFSSARAARMRAKPFVFGCAKSEWVRANEAGRDGVLQRDYLAA